MSCISHPKGFGHFYGCAVAAYWLCTFAVWAFTDEWCEENPEACAATWEHIQIEAIQFCEQYPEECQEAFEAYVESFGEGPGNAP
jgi:hypothetical protein